MNFLLSFLLLFVAKASYANEWIDLLKKQAEQSFWNSFQKNSNQGQGIPKCSKHNIQGCIDLGNMLFNQKDNKSAATNFQIACEEGNKEACFATARAHELSGNKELAIPYYEKSCSFEYNLSCHNLGDLYYQKGFTDKAKMFFIKGCLLKYGGSCSNLGVMANQKNNNKEAMKYFIQACEFNSDKGCFNLGGEYLKLKKDEAEIPLKKACEKNYIPACNDLGVFYESIRKNKELATAQYKIACENQFALACTNLGVIYESQNNSADAKLYYQKGCEQGDSKSCGAYGFILYQDKNLEQAKMFLIKGCEGSYDNACYNLGVYYFDAKELDLALEFYLKSCDLQLADGCTAAASIYKEKNNEAKMFEYDKMACDMKDNNGCALYGADLLIAGKTDESKPFLIKGCEDKIGEACYNLACFYGRKNQSSQTLKYLEESFKLGYNDWANIEVDNDLKIVLSSSEFKKLILKYKNEQKK